jgi:hypothetical protein
LDGVGGSLLQGFLVWGFVCMDAVEAVGRAPTPDEDAEAVRATLSKLLASRKTLDGSTLLCAQLAGSFAFNLNVASSDEDYFGIYMEPIENTILGTGWTVC